MPELDDAQGATLNPVDLGSIWESDGQRVIVVATADDGAIIRPIVRGDIRGRRQRVAADTAGLVGYAPLPDMWSPTLECVDSASAVAAREFLRREEGIYDAFVAGNTVVAPWATNRVAISLCTAAKANRWATPDQITGLVRRT
jgi:hypothetical protein